MAKTRDLFDSLEDLRKRMQSSGLERTAGLKDAMGDDCAYYRKSRNILLEKDYEDLKNLFLETLGYFRGIEGKDFGVQSTAPDCLKDKS